MDFKKIACEIFKYVKNNNHIVSLGIRSLEDDESVEIGTELRNSYTWDFENDCSTYHTTGEVVDGTCSTGIRLDARDIDDDTIEELATFIEEAWVTNLSYGTSLGKVVIGGTSHTYGTDENEYIISNAEVVVLLK